MRTILILYLLLVFPIFFSCNGCSSKDDEPLLVIKSPLKDIPEEPMDYLLRSYYIEDSVKISMKIYVPKSELFPLLDSIIQIVRTCTNPRKSDLALVDGGKMALSFSATERNGYKLIKIRTISMHLQNFYKYNACFDHYEYRFYYQGDFLNFYFEETNEINVDNYIDPSKLISFIDDRDYEWGYIIEEYGIVAYRYNDCDKFWTDWDLYSKIYNLK